MSVATLARPVVDRLAAVRAFLSIGADSKTIKGVKYGVRTAIMYLAPVNIALAGKSVCAWATKGCRAACLYTAGRGTFNSVQTARINRTLAFWQDRQGTIGRIDAEIVRHKRLAKKHTLLPAVRLNGTSDIPWESLAPSLFMDHADCMFYDYTKGAGRMLKDLPGNYHLTFSRSEETPLSQIDELIARGQNVAVVFGVKRKAPLPEAWNGHKVIDGDLSDIRFGDPDGVIVGLRAKGSASKDKTGFVVQSTIGSDGPNHFHKGLA